MRRTITILLLFFALLVKAQSSDYINLFSDRDNYFSGETIFVKIFSSEKEPSGIVHVDLVNPGGRIIKGISKKIIDHQTDGYIILPDSLGTGTYLLCTSSISKPEVTVKELFIFNRFSGVTGVSTMQRASDFEPITEQLANINVEGIQESYKTREKVNFSIHLPAEMTDRLTGDLMISLSEKTEGIDAQTFVQKAVLPLVPRIEKEGVLVEGAIVDVNTGKPFEKGVVFLSVPDSVPKLQYFITGVDGKFNFQLTDYCGNIPVVIQAYDPEKKSLLKVVLNHRDSLKSIVPKFSEIAISSGLQTFVSNEIDLVTLRKIFNLQELTIQKPTLNKGKEYPFYGVPAEIIHPEVFIELPDFTEISRELLPGVKFRAYNRIPTMQILNPLTQNYFVEQPLVLLNGVPVLDLNVIKNLGTKDIERIELCRNERFYGNLGFQGVVAIYTPKKEPVLLKESDELVKINLDVLQSAAALNIPKESIAPNEPDLRKVLLWETGVKKAETVHLEFITSDVKGSFQLTIRGNTKDGTIVRKDQIFEVK